MRLKYLSGLALAWPMERLLRARWFPLFRTFLSRRHWVYDVCRFAGTRDFRIVFDVGANVGQTALYVRGFFPHADIHSFEPVSDTFRQLEDNLRSWPNLHAHRLALGRAPESREIVLQDCSELNSLAFTPGPGPAATGRVERIEIGTLDQFCEARGLDGIDILKTDAQARDVDVLAGAERLISSAKIPFIYTEVTFQPDDTTNTTYAAINEYLSPRGWRLAGIYEQNGCGPRSSWLGYSNALFVHPEALRRRFPTSQVDSGG
jgi:FkbM family methyltransferase